MNPLTDDDSTATQKLSGYDFYRRVLGAPRLVVAPMVSRCAFTLLLDALPWISLLCFPLQFPIEMFIFFICI